MTTNRFWLAKADLTQVDPVLARYILDGAGINKGIRIKEGTQPPVWLAENIRNIDGSDITNLAGYRFDAVYVEVRRGGKVEINTDGPQGSEQVIYVHPSGYDVIPQQGNRLATTIQLTLTDQISGIAVTRLFPADREPINSISGLPDPTSKTDLGRCAGALYPMFTALNALSHGVPSGGQPPIFDTAEKFHELVFPAIRAVRQSKGRPHPSAERVAEHMKMNGSYPSGANIQSIKKTLLRSRKLIEENEHPGWENWRKVVQEALSETRK